MGQHHILIIEDEKSIASMVCGFVGRAGWRASHLASGRGLERVLREDPPDLILLDLMLPQEDGLSIAQRIRTRSATPIIMLTALGEEDDRVAGFETGADDYVTKPFSARELIARIEAVLRRSSGEVGRGVLRRLSYAFEGWTLDARQRELRDPQGVRIVLTGTEFDLMQAFCSNAGAVLARDRLVRLIGGQTAEPYDRRIDTLISRIRQKIEADPGDPKLIKTIRNGGYMLAPAVEVMP